MRIYLQNPPRIPCTQGADMMKAQSTCFDWCKERGLVVGTDVNIGVRGDIDAGTGEVWVEPITR